MAVLRNRVLWVSVAILVVWIIVSSLMPSDKVRIKKLIDKGREACESEDIEALMGLVAMEYRDPYGLTYVTVRKIYEAAFLKYDDIKITMRNLKITVEDNGEEASATFSARAEATVADTKGDPQNLPIRDVGATDSAKLWFKKISMGWKVVSAEEIGAKDW